MIMTRLVSGTITRLGPRDRAGSCHRPPRPDVGLVVERISYEQRLTPILVTHRVAEALSITDGVIVLDRVSRVKTDSPAASLRMATISQCLRPYFAAGWRANVFKVVITLSIEYGFCIHASGSTGAARRRGSSSVWAGANIAGMP